jgi:hypothetical protein
MAACHRQCAAGVLPTGSRVRVGSAVSSDQQSGSLPPASRGFHPLPDVGSTCEADGRGKAPPGIYLDGRKLPSASSLLV